jgi:hypothetical protein
MPNDRFLVLQYEGVWHTLTRLRQRSHPLEKQTLAWKSEDLGC